LRQINAAGGQFNKLSVGGVIIMLQIDPDKVCYIIVKSREFDAKVEPVEPDPGSNAADDGERVILEDFADDPTFAELMTVLRDLNDDEMLDVLTLAWIGRGDFTADEWDEAHGQAEDVMDEKAAEYLAGIPVLSDYLEEGLSEMGFSCENFEMGHM
jgi:hypothetical protein